MKVAKIWSITEADLETGILWSADLDQDTVIYANGWGLDAQETFIEHCSIHNIQVNLVLNDKNPESPTEGINQALRRAYDDYYEYEVFDIMYPFKFTLNRIAIEEIGYIDSIFRQQFFMFDYMLRARIKGVIPGNFPEDFETTELMNNGISTEWDLVKFGSKWSIPPDINPQDFWEYLKKQKYEWVDSMRVD